MNRRTGHNTTKTPALTGGDDRPAPACQGRADVYDMLGETSRSDEFEEAREAAQNMCGTCLLRRPAEARACLDEAQKRKERWVSVVLGRPLRGLTAAKPASQTALHGTDAGYFRHLRKTKDEPCDDCRKAHAEAQARYNRRRGRSAA